MSLTLDVHAELRRGSFALRAELSVPPGLTVLLGPSGAGKSLTLQAITGLAPLDAGRITLGKRVLADVAAGSALPPSQRHLGYVPQASALFPHLSVAGNVAYALPRLGLAWPAGRQSWRDVHARRVADLLALVRLPGFEQRSARGLSGGEAQRVALARALAAEPEALLLDEPLSALDGPTRAALRDDLRAVVLASGVPALVVTHDLAEARALADRLVVLIDGRVVAQGALEDVLASPPTASAALLLGWIDLLPVAYVAPTDHGVEVTLPSRQRLALPREDATVAAAGGDMRLALRADRLLLDLGDGIGSVLARRGDGALPLDASAPQAGAVSAVESVLVGTLTASTDMGAYYTVRIALAGEPADSPSLVLTCSPREWAAAALSPGALVRVRVPLGAARLVVAS